MWKCSQCDADNADDLKICANCKTEDSSIKVNLLACTNCGHTVNKEIIANYLKSSFLRLFFVCYFLSLGLFTFIIDVAHKYSPGIKVPNPHQGAFIIACLITIFGWLDYRKKKAILEYKANLKNNP